MTSRTDASRNLIELTAATRRPTTKGDEMCKAILMALCLSLSTSALFGQTCTNKTVVSSVVDSTGSSANKGRSVEGPVCVEVYFNPLPGPVTLQTSSTQTSGPDPGTVFLGNGGSGAPGAAQKKGMMAPGTPTISSQFNAISVGFSGDQGLVQALPTKYSQAAASQDLLTGDLKQLLSATMGIDPSTPALSVAVASVAKNSILPDLLTALAAQRDYQPSDKGAPPLLADLQALQTELNNMPFDFSDGDKLQAGETISCRGANTKKIGWTDWYAQCKDQYDSLKKSLQDATASAQTYSTGSDNDKALKNKAAIVLYWKARLDALGITSPGPINLLPFSVARQDIGCHSIFNFNSSTAVSLVVVDERPTLDGTAPTAKASDPFLTVTCASRIGVSAGAGFSTILQHGFAIVKSAGGTNGASVNRFDALNDSRFNPLPMALAHARLKEFAGHLIALHATVGVAGNLQGQSSGGSAVEFLLGGSVSFVRVIYLSAGLHIGTKDELAGGFKVGDLVPSDITTIQGQVKRSYTTGFGFAISFTKP